jgi:hypothetical protein
LRALTSGGPRNISHKTGWLKKATASCSVRAAYKNSTYVEEVCYARKLPIQTTKRSRPDLTTTSQSSAGNIITAMNRQFLLRFAMGSKSRATCQL